tara:strand:- start:105 stop:671 length:567 start_codon:yes stop_codon:yes gene_type:complete
MKILIFLLLFSLLVNCSKPKTVLICGDHVCINKEEAEQYFQENLSIEVKILNKNIDTRSDLVELNLNENINGNKNVNIFPKKQTSKKLRTLSNNEVIKIKKDIQKKKNETKIAKKTIKKKEKNMNNKISNDKKKLNKDNKIKSINLNKNENNLVDVCTMLKDCTIEGISEYLLKEGKKKDFPDITVRQ